MNSDSASGPHIGRGSWAKTPNPILILANGILLLGGQERPLCR